MGAAGRQGEIALAGTEVDAAGAADETPGAVSDVLASREAMTERWRSPLVASGLRRKTP